MEGLLGQLGIDWRLFLSQAVNFFILLVILRQFVYKPLFVVIKKRQEIITTGLAKAAKADTRLNEVEAIAKERMKIAEQKSIGIIEDAKSNAKTIEQTLNRQSEQRHQELLKQIDNQLQREKEEMKEHILKEGRDLVKRMLIKTVELKPDEVDEALIQKAISEMKS